MRELGKCIPGTPQLHAQLGMAEIRGKCYPCTVRTFARPVLGSKNTHEDFNGSKGLCSKVDMQGQHLGPQEYLEHPEQLSLQLTEA